MARKATGRSKRSRSTTKSKTSRTPARKTTKRATARPKPAARKKATPRAKGRDFGIPARKTKVAAAVADETKFRPAGDHRQDPRQPRSGVDSRTAGVGMRDAGPGSDSGGDVDSDIVGLGAGAADRPLSEPPDSAASDETSDFEDIE